jgi:hypothetical protein
MHNTDIHHGHSGCDFTKFRKHLFEGQMPIGILRQPQFDIGHKYSGGCIGIARYVPGVQRDPIFKCVQVYIGDKARDGLANLLGGDHE